MMTRVIYLPPAIAFVMLAWLLFFDHARWPAKAVAIAVVGVGAWLQFGSARFSMLWLAGLLLHIAFSIYALFRRQLRSY